MPRVLGRFFLRAVVAILLSSKPGLITASFVSLPQSSVRSPKMCSTKDDDASVPPRRNNESAAAKAVDFARIVGRLKTTPRTGWVRRGVPRYESVADHSWRVATLSLLLAGRKDVDFTNKCLPMALIHDVAESLIGDIAPDDNVSAQDKRQMETDATEVLAQLLAEATNDNDDPENGQILLYRSYS